MNNSRRIAVNVLNLVFQEGAYSNLALNKALNESNLDDKDKALTTEIVYGTIKYKYAIDKILNNYVKTGVGKLDIFVLNVLRIGIYQLRYLDKIPNFAAVNECVELGKTKSPGACKLINGVLRNYLRNEDKVYYDKDNLIQELSFEYSYPNWIVKFLMDQYGKEKCAQILRGLNTTPSITVRVNNLKSDYETVWDKLVEYGYNVEEGEVCPEAIRIIKGKSIENNPLFKEGFITVQDESAMLTAPSMDLEEKMTVLDLCSAPGGKTTHISEIMNNTGRVYAFDIHEHKLKLIEDNIQRLGIKDARVIEMDAEIFNPKYENYADRVLIDVPCSGIGIIRKKPEIKYTKKERDLNQLVRIQRKILTNAAKYVKKDGILLYSTCTLNKNENEENIKWFLEKFPNFKVEPVFYGNLSNLVYDKLGMLTILPSEYMDGFFIAKLRKQW